MDAIISCMCRAWLRLASSKSSRTVVFSSHHAHIEQQYIFLNV